MEPQLSRTQAYWVLNGLPSIGPISLNRLLDHFGGDPCAALEASRSELDTVKGLQRKAIDALVALHRSPPGPFEPYDMAVYQREAALLPEWFAPAAGFAVDEPGYRQAWEEVLAPLLERQRPGVTVLRDYHAENIMLLPGGGQGLIDFQDALVGHPAYDLVSLLQDARRDVSPELERAMLDHYAQASGGGTEFEADYARLGAQRNAKIMGIFVRLWKRDGKPGYLAHLPRVSGYMERDLRHPVLAPLKAWLDTHVPQSLRAEILSAE